LRAAKPIPLRATASDGFRKGSTHPASCFLFLVALGCEILIGRSRGPALQEQAEQMLPGKSAATLNQSRAWIRRRVRHLTACVAAQP
jgi:hypothetical protein